jgi:Ca2+-transporting ATPase
MQYFGLNESEAIELLKKYGENKIERKKKISAFKIFLSQFKSPLILLLIFASLVSLAINYYHKEEFLDTFLILAIVFISSLLGFFQEYKAEKTVESLQKLAAPKARVIREGKEKEIEAIKIVPGDLIVVESGDIIPADAEILEGKLQIDESILTGESKAVEKSKRDKIFSGTHVFSGRAVAKVLDTGMKTEIGKIAAKLQEVREEKTPFEEKMEMFTKKIIVLTILIIALTFLFSFNKFGVLKAGLLAVALAVAAIPEGLPAFTTISLALGSREMAKKNALVRRLKIIESIGSLDVICTDKTGTLTEGKMKVKDFWFFEESEKAREISLKVCYYCNNSKQILKDNKLTWVGDETEIALKEYSKQFIKDEGKRLEEFSFSPERMMMSVIHKFSNEVLVLTKGAPETIVKKCSKILLKDGVKKLTEEMKKKIIEKNSEFASQGIRVLALAYKPTKEKFEKEDIEKDLIFVSLVSLLDLPRKEAKEAIEECYSAGIRVIMITGDNPQTAKAIAEMVGLNSSYVATGEELDKMDDSKLEEILDKNTNIFARASPFHKLRILEILKKKGLKVGMTGDGVNDSLALKKADVGIAMGIKGSEVAKEASDIILFDDNFSSIRNAIKEGRKIFENIRKFVLYLFSSNIAEVFIVLFFSLFSPFLVLLPIHLLWINLVTDGLPAISLANDPPRKDIMKGKAKIKIFDRRDLAFILSMGSLLSFLIILEYFILGFESQEEVRAVVFSSFVIFEMFKVFIVQNFEGSLSFENLKKNKMLVISIISTILLQIFLVYFLPSYFKIISLGLEDWLTICGFGAILLFVGLTISKSIKKFY